MGRPVPTIPDDVWRAIAAPLPPRRRLLRWVIGAVLVVLVVFGLARAGVTQPRLSVAPVAVTVDAGADTVDLRLRITDRGWVSALPALGPGAEHHGITPLGARRADGRLVEFLEIDLRRGQSAEATLVVRRTCPSGTDLLDAWWVVAYGPVGGSEVHVPVETMPASAVRGLSGSQEWRAELREVLCG